MDKVTVFRDEAGEWRWRRVAPNNEIVAAAHEGYTNHGDCLVNAERVNGGAYVLEIDSSGNSNTTTDTSQETSSD